MDKNVQFLNYIYQNAKMGTESIGALLPKVSDQKLAGDLNTQLDTYRGFAQTASTQLQQSSQTPKENGFISKATVHAGIAMNTMLNTCPSHVAEMMINGSTMGIIDMTKKLKEFSDCNPNVKDLGKELLKNEQNNIERLKSYLK